MFTRNQFFMLFAFSSVVVLSEKLLAAEIAEKSIGDLEAAMREFLLTLVVFAALVFFFGLCRRSTKKAIKRPDKFTYERPATQRIRKQTLAESTSKELPPAAEISRMVTEYTRWAELVRSLAKEGDSIKATMAMNQLENTCGTPGVQEYSALISMCSKANDVEGVRTWMRRLKEKGHTANVVCFNALINVHAKRGEISNAVAVAREMKDAGVDCDVVTYNTIIDACARKGDAAEAQVWMRKMLAAGVNPSVISFCSVMHACAKASLNSDLEHWIEQADMRGIQLNMICFSAVINAFAQNGDLTSAGHWLTRMKKYNINPTVHCFAGMIDTVCKDGDVERAGQVLDRMREAHIVPEARMLSALVKAACHAGQFDCAQDWINKAATEGVALNMQAIPASIAAKLTIPSDVNLNKLLSKEIGDEASAKIAGDSAGAQALVGKRFVGTIKEFITDRYGYITCDETYAVFKRDIFLSSYDNQQLLAKGQMVSFVVQIDQRRGLPRASDLRIMQK